MCEYKNYKIIIWSLSMITSAFSEAEIIQILEKGFNHKSKEIRIHAAQNVTRYFECEKVVSLLKKYVEIEKNKEVKSSILFNIDIIENKRISREGNRLVTTWERS